MEDEMNPQVWVPPDIFRGIRGAVLRSAIFVAIWVIADNIEGHMTANTSIPAWIARERNAIHADGERNVGLRHSLRHETQGDIDTLTEEWVLELLRSEEHTPELQSQP